MKSISLQDIQRVRYQNQFTRPGNLPLNIPERIYYITRVRASGAWTIQGKSNSQDPDERLRTIQGSGTEQFYSVLCFDSIDSMTGVQDISGFWVPAQEF
ncbi:hypothetical protein [Leptospira sp. GIMC2001]|uniref:hypothetical protein n=1 Tax=Leptospira sp. GIMC2001 TaxID=1513297 RepID=UPI00234AE398|nr:hypothetical protein [Leptospira sp. GIMC2001]WCL50718.1 hypothetical protein O4O04_07880 [Leptospira sp. GIMC2001]